ncbi:MAG: TcfC E-set like domain-containing protein [Pseudomonadota bacterium]|nr:TcfC E-set like domain-containing protein [Pseudomonadota bacterium]
MTRCVIAIVIAYISVFLAVAAANQSSSNGGATPATDIRTTGKPPPGFEDLLAPQRTLVDVYFGGRLVGSAMVVYDPAVVSIDEPADLARLIPQIIEPGAVVRALTGPLPVNAHRVCPNRPRPGCGILAPDVAGVIFDADRFRLDVFVNPAFLSVSPPENQRFLPSPESGISAVQRLSASYSGSNVSSDNYNVLGNSLLASGALRLESLWSYSSQDNFEIDTLFGQWDREGYAYQLGAIRARGSQFISETDVIGAGFQTSLRTRTDLDQVSGTQVQLFLPVRAQVDIIKDGRLVFSKFYEAGTQILDTSALPDGAYPITIRIREASGVERQETRFYVKAVELPPVDTPLYHVQLGALRDWDDNSDLPAYRDELFYRTGLGVRMSDQFGLHLGATGLDQYLAFEAGGFTRGRWYRLGVSALASTDADWGVSANGGAQLGPISGGINLRRVWNSREVPEASELLGPGAIQANAMLTYGFSRGALSLRGDWNDVDDPLIDQDETWSIGALLSLLLWQDTDVRLTLDSELSENQSGTYGALLLTLRGDDGRWNRAARFGGRRESRELIDGSADSGSELAYVGGFQLGWRDEAMTPGDLLLTAGANRDVDSEFLTLDGDWRTERGRIQATAQRSLPDGGAPNTNYGANLSFGIATNADTLAVGGSAQGLSTVVVEVTGNATKARFDVLVNGQPRGYVATDSRIPVFVEPYETYRVRLRQRDVSLVDYDTTEYEVTVYPGTVKSVSFEANQLQVVVGQAVRSNGQTVGLARIRGAVGYAASESNGFFQAEVAGAKTLRFEPLDGEPCEVSLPLDTSVDQPVVSLGTIACLPVEFVTPQ